MEEVGVVFDLALKLNVHINHTISFSYKIIGLRVRNSSEFLDANALVTLLNTFVRSKLEYLLSGIRLRVIQ